MERGGAIEGIQLWLNLPAEKKMIQPNYQHAENDEFEIISSEDNKIKTKVAAGTLNCKSGRIATQTSVRSFMIEAKAGGVETINFSNLHQSMLYLLKGKALVNNEVALELNENQLVNFSQDGGGFTLEAENYSLLLFLSDEPFNEEVATYGPYGMNTQTELLEAMRD